MSDDEDLIYKKPQKSIHYGTLDHSDWVKQQQTLEDIQSDEDEYEPEKKKSAISSSQAVGASSSNIQISNEYYELEQEM